jgi:tetratricopeptide (TPR) repeat protein
LKKANPANPAIHQIETAVKKAKDNPQLQEAARLAQAGQPENAVAAYRAAFGSNTPPTDWAIPYYETLAGTPGGWEQATAAIEELVRKNPSVGEYKLVLGRLYTYRPATRLKGVSLLEGLTGEYAQSAQKAWKQALTWEAGSTRSAESLKRYLSRYPEADLQTALKKASPGDGLVAGEDLRAAYQALKADQLDTAEKLFNAAAGKSPKEAGAHAGLGFVRMKREDFTAAVTSFEAAASLAPTNRVVRDALKEARFWKAMQQGTVALQASRSEDAVVAFKNAVAERPNDPSAIEGYAGALISHGDYAKAVPLLERLTKANSTQARTWMNLVIAKHRALGSQAAMEVAAKVPAEVAAKLGSSAEYMIVIANLHKDAGRDQEARKAFAAAAALAERQADLPSYVQISLADFHSQLGESAKAGRMYREAIEREPSNLDAWEGYLLTSNRTDEAAEALNKLQALPASVHEAAQARPSFLRAVAMLEANVGNFAVAEKVLNQAAAAETSKGRQPSLSTELQTGQLWLEQGKSAQAHESPDA